MSEQVKRYDPEGYSQPASVSGTGTHMIECPIGDYVLASDYDALAQRRQELDNLCDQWAESAARLIAEVADLKARLLDAERSDEQLVRLRAENRRLSGALAPFAKCAELFDDDVRSCNMPNSGPFYSWPRRHHEYELTVENLREARATMEHKP